MPDQRAEVSQGDEAVQPPDGDVFLEEPVFAMKRAVVALAYELPEPVWQDVCQKWNAVAVEVRRLRTFIERVAAGFDDADALTVQEEACDVLNA